MRHPNLVVLIAIAFAVAACGSSKSSKSNPRPNGSYGLGGGGAMGGAGFTVDDDPAAQAKAERDTFGVQADTAPVAAGAPAPQAPAAAETELPDQDIVPSPVPPAGELSSAVDPAPAAPAPRAARPARTRPAARPAAAPVARATGTLVRINSIDGNYAPAHARELYVYPGDVVTLSAGAFAAGGEPLEPARQVEDFEWSTNIRGDLCRPLVLDDCLAHSNFQLNPYGVSYYVPYTMKQQIKIAVRLASGEVDYVVLRNSMFGEKAVDWALITDPAQYPAAKLDPNVALARMGRWVSIGGVRYFAPTTFVTEGEPAWKPFRHGYWGWDKKHGCTWVSNDPWGFVTDHRGLWHHHPVYGWVWAPFSDFHYEPHVVSFFEMGDDIGWLPYRPEFATAYANDAFDDGFALGLALGRELGAAEYAYDPGFTIISRSGFAARDVIDELRVRQAFVYAPNVLERVRVVFSSGYVYGVPGGGLPLSAMSHLGVTLVAADVETIRGPGGARFYLPHRAAPMPRYAEFLGGLQQMGHPISLGAFAQPNGSRYVLVPPASGGRGYAAAPILRDAHGRSLGAMPSRSKYGLTLLNPKNPLAAGAGLHLQKRAIATEVPKFNPKAATPNAIFPKTLETKRTGSAHGRADGAAPANPPSAAAPAPKHQGERPAAPSQPAPAARTAAPPVARAESKSPAAPAARAETPRAEAPRHEAPRRAETPRPNAEPARAAAPARAETPRPAGPPAARPEAPRPAAPRTLHTGEWHDMTDKQKGARQILGAG